jgi:hypothetical protein
MASSLGRKQQFTCTVQHVWLQEGPVWCVSAQPLFGVPQTRLADKVVALLKVMLYPAWVMSALVGDHFMGGKEEIQVFLGTAAVVNSLSCAAEDAC